MSSKKNNFYSDNSLNRVHINDLISFLLILFSELITIVVLQYNLLSNNLLFRLYKFVIIIVGIIYIMLNAYSIIYIKEVYKIWKIVIPMIFGIINNLLLITVLFSFHIMKWFNLFVDLYVISLYAVVIIYEICTLFPFTYNQKTKKEKIGNFYEKFSTYLSPLQLKNVIAIIFDDRKLSIFLKEKYNVESKTDGEVIIKNLRSLRSKNINAYNKLKSEVDIRCETHFWDAIATFLAFCTFINPNFLTYIFTKKVNIKDYHLWISCFIVVVLFMFGSEAFKGLRRYYQQNFYKAIKYLFKESES